MSAKKVVIIVLSSAIALILGFCTFWIINNYDAIEYAMSGSALYTKSDLDKAYEDGYNAAGYDVKDLSEIITGLRSDLDSKSAELKKVKSNYDTLLKNYNDLETSSKEEQAELNVQITELNNLISDLENEIKTLNISLQSYEEFKAQLESENTVIATFVYDGSIISVQGYEKGSKIQAVEIPEDTDEIKFNGWIVNYQAIDITDYTINENTIFTADLSYYAKNWVLRANAPDDISFKQSCLWTDGENLYYSYGNVQYIFNDELSSWEEKIWNGDNVYIIGNYVWTDGENIYYSNLDDQYVLNKETSTWEDMVWPGREIANGFAVWTDGDNIYYYTNAIFNKETLNWDDAIVSLDPIYKTFDYLDSFWTDGINLYGGYHDIEREKYIHFIINKELSEWQEVSTFNITDFYSGDVVTINNKCYVISRKTSALYEFCPVKENNFNSLVLIDENPKVYSGYYIWNDGENNYYSYDKTHYVFNKETSSWDEVSWNGLESFWGSTVWTDGENVYLTLSSKSYVLNKETSTWEEKTWNGVQYFDGSYVWSDGDNIFYSKKGETQLVLNKETDTWEEMIWGGYSDIRGSHVWTDGENYYYSESTTQLVLNKETYIWEPSSFTGKPHFHGDVVWTVGENVYYNSYTSQCILDKDINHWEQKVWDTDVSFSAGFSSETGVWTDGENYYLTMKYKTYKFIHK